MKIVKKIKPIKQKKAKKWLDRQISETRGIKLKKLNEFFEQKTQENTKC